MSGTEYELTRTFNSATLSVDDQKIATGAGQVTKKVEEILGLSGRLFLDLRTAPQEEASTILTLGATKISALLNTVTQVDVIDRVLDQCSKMSLDINGYLERKDELDTKTAAELVEKLRQELLTKHAALTKTQAGQQKAAEFRDAAQLQHSDLNTQRETFIAAAHNYSELEGRIATLEESVSQKEHALERLKPFPAKQLKELKERKEHLDKQLQQERTALGAYQANVERLQPAMHERAKKIASAESSLAETMDQIDLSDPAESEGIHKVHTRKGDLQAQFSAVEEKATTLDKSLKDAICPTCKRPYDSTEHDVEHLQSDLKGLRVRMLDLGVKLQEADREIEAMEKERTRLQKLNEAQLHLEVSLNALKQQQAEDAKVIEKAPPQTEGLWDQVVAAREVYAQAETSNNQYIAAAEAFEAAADRLRTSRIDLKKKQASMPEEVTPEQIAEALERYTTAQEIAGELTTKLAEQTTAYSTGYQQFQREQQRLQELQKKELELKEKIDRAIRVRDLAKYLRKNRDAFTQKVWSTILGYASEFVAMATSGTITAMDRDEEGEFRYTEDGYNMPVKAASGLQKAILGTGVRLALAQAVAAPVDFFLLDEVTAGASDEASMAVTQALTQTGSQIVGITHRTMDAAVADKVISL